MSLRTVIPIIFDHHQVLQEINRACRGHGGGTLNVTLTIPAIYEIALSSIDTESLRREANILFQRAGTQKTIEHLIIEIGNHWRVQTQFITRNSTARSIAEEAKQFASKSPKFHEQLFFLIPVDGRCEYVVWEKMYWPSIPPITAADANHENLKSILAELPEATDESTKWQIGQTFTVTSYQVELRNIGKLIKEKL